MTAAVSILVPCYNEARSIGRLLDALRQQTFPVGQMEIVFADGLSSDGTRDVIHEFARRHRDLSIRVVDNPGRTIPSAMNRALEASNGEIVIRLDAHSAPLPDYVSRCVEVLQSSGAANVGGLWLIEPGGEGSIARGIAAAVADRLGAGDARYRIGGPAGPVDTVPFGAFRRDWLRRVGGYDESLLTNEDYELNWRIRRAHGLVWFDPRIRCVYYARPTLRALAQQYWRYGLWKARMLLRHPASLRLRQILPPTFVLGSAALALGALRLPAARTALLVVWGVYLVALLERGLAVAFRAKSLAMVATVPAALLVVHGMWGAGFLAGLVYRPPARTAERR